MRSRKNRSVTEMLLSLKLTPQRYGKGLSLLLNVCNLLVRVILDFRFFYKERLMFYLYVCDPERTHFDFLPDMFRDIGFRIQPSLQSLFMFELQDHRGSNHLSLVIQHGSAE